MRSCKLHNYVTLVEKPVLHGEGVEIFLTHLVNAFHRTLVLPLATFMEMISYDENTILNCQQIHWFKRSAYGGELPTSI